jgi:FixJ family two-component response regulator
MKSTASTDRPVVFVVDDSAAVRDALDSLIRSTGLRVETFKRARDFLRYSPRPDVPACAVLDVRLPDLDGLEIQRQLLKSASFLPVIFITGHGDIPMSVRAMKDGAVEFLTKPFRNEDLLDAIQTALARDRKWLKRNAELSNLGARYKLLTPRERQVMELVVRGMLNKQIAAQLGITEITIKIHRGNAMKKMRAASLPELVRMSEMLQANDAHQTKV